MYRRPALQLPLDVPSGEPFFLVPAGAVLKDDERCVTYTWLSDRSLFGEVYRRLLPEHYDAMSADGGVLIGSFIPSAQIVEGLTYPGDIDVLVIPYDGGELILSHTLAIEIKVIRASFSRQGKSPNQYGFSQAAGLLDAGFPYVAVGHLIVSDRSPEEAWREMAVARIVDSASDRCELLSPAMHDMLPSDLLARSHGRLKNNRPDSLLGHFSAYVGGSGMWFPFGEVATLNPRASTKTLDEIYAYYQDGYRYFLKTRKYPPSEPTTMFGSNRCEWLNLMVEKMRRDFHGNL